MTHDELVDRARQWLCRDHPVVITEMAGGAGEEADAIGWKGSFSTLVECKASRADFIADRNKRFRRNPEQGIGIFRYYMSPPGVLAPDEITNGWGLIEPHGRRIHTIVKAEQQWAWNYRGEMYLLISALRRPSGLAVKRYTYQTKCRATLGVEPIPELKEGP